MAIESKEEKKGKIEPGSFNVKISTVEEDINGGLSKQEIEVQGFWKDSNIRFEKNEEGHKVTFENKKKEKKPSHNWTKLLVVLEVILIALTIYKIAGYLT